MKEYFQRSELHLSLLKPNLVCFLSPNTTGAFHRPWGRVSLGAFAKEPENAKKKTNVVPFCIFNKVIFVKVSNPHKRPLLFK